LLIRQHWYLDQREYPMENDPGSQPPGVRKRKGERTQDQAWTNEKF
jgi:hypothetical protein